MTKNKLFAGASSFALAAAGVLGATIISTSPANATPSACENYLHSQGYILTNERVDACAYGASGGTMRLFCISGLINTGVTSGIAQNACDLADS